MSSITASGELLRLAQSLDRSGVGSAVPRKSRAPRALLPQEAP
ncbi:MAG TPA: hypothetical protein VIL00_16630 [Pseudonocardiaceae bacterium]